MHHLKDKRYIVSLKEEAVLLIHEAQEADAIPADNTTSEQNFDKISSKCVSADSDLPQDEERLQENDDDIESVISEYDEVDLEEITPTPAEATVFSCFKNWLMSLDGSAKKERDARLHVAQLAAISRAIGGEKGNDDVLNIINADILRDRWLEKFRESKRPGTVKAYLHSLRFFSSFLKFQESIVSVEQERLLTFENRVQLWLKSLNKSLNRRKWEKRDEDLQRIATPTDYVNFDQSQQVWNAIKILSAFMGSYPSLSKQDYVCVRDFLLSTLIMDNASRSGAVAGLRVQDVAKATKEGDTMVMTVLDHKTLESSGPAVLGTSLVTFQYLDIFITKMRSRIVEITGSGSDSVFLSFVNGTPMSSSKVSDRLGSFWRQAIGKHMNATLIRKSSVTAVHRGNPEKRGELATLMNHSVKTAENVYFIASKKKTSAKASSFLRGIMRNPCDEKAESETEDMDDGTLIELFPNAFECGQIRMREVRDAVELNPELAGRERTIYERVRYVLNKRKKGEVLNLPSETEDEETKLRRIGVEIEAGPSSKETEAEEDNMDSSESVVHSEGKIVRENNPQARNSFSKEQNKVIAKLFKMQIETNESITEEHVAKQFKKDAILQDLCEHLTTKQMSDKIRSMRRAFRLRRRRK